MSDNGKSSPKAAALIALRRAEQELEPMLVQALIAIAIRHVEQIQELRKPRREKAAKEPAA